MPAQPLLITSCAFTLLLGSAACGSPESTERTVDGTPTSAVTAAAFTDEDLDAYEKGLRREIDAVRAAQKQAMAAKDAQERGMAMQAQWEDATVPLGAETAGLPVDRYRELRTTVNEVFTTLDFQGKINGPLSIDLSRVDAATKERLGRDPFSDLPPPSATALRGRMDRLVPIWIEDVTLVAVAG